MSSRLGFRPLYRQVYDTLVSRIAGGEWEPGHELPSEHALAAELEVSQGTVRKALNVMADESLVERHQGKGTYVAENTAERSLFRFFRLAWPGGTRTTPSCSQEDITERLAAPAERAQLNLKSGSRVYQIKRTRLVNDKPVVFDDIIVPVDLFSGLEKLAPLQNELYSLYQSKFGHYIVKVDEEIGADEATAEDAARLQIPVGKPVLCISRIAISIDGTAVELRTSRCVTSELVYAVTLK